MSQPDTKNRILNAAERLFALQGFANTSLREVTGEAKVNLAAVNYHFGSKDTLLDAIMERRIAPLNQKRITLLQKLDESGEAATIRAIITCFIKPTLDLLTSDKQSNYFVLLIGRVLAEVNGPQKKIFYCHMQPVLSPFFDAFKQICPHLDMTTVVWGMNFSIGAMIHCVRMFNSEQLPFKENIPINIETLEKMLIDFVTSGLEKTYA